MNTRPQVEGVVVTGVVEGVISGIVKAADEIVFIALNSDDDEFVCPVQILNSDDDPFAITLIALNSSDQEFNIG